MKDYYPEDGRSGDSSPGVWTLLLSYLPNEIPWERLTPSLNGPFDRWISRRVLRRPHALSSRILEFWFGPRGRDYNDPGRRKPRF